MVEPFKGPTRGAAFWQRQWIAICSRHAQACPDCHLCRQGRYHWALALSLSACVSALFPSLWRWWVNRPGSRARRRLEAMFPGLRGGD